MKNMKPIAVLAAVLFAVTLIIPTALVLPFMEKTTGKLDEDLEGKEIKVESNEPAIEVAVYRAGQEKIENLPLEEYIVGVVAAEMPADFELEALKAQAITARTYFAYLMNGEKKGVPEGADVTDTENHQVYKSDEELRKQWGKDYQKRVKKIREAVQATSGQILTYEGAPIYSAFFSTSNGFTENSEDYWSSPRPYLKSVESPWDVNTEKFNGQKVVSIKEFEKKLGVKLTNSSEVGKILERTKGNRVGKVDINGKVLTGKDIRETLELKSSDFTWERKGKNIVINTKGFGHGVGMSQFGANGMAKEGKTYKEIVQHYYQGVQIDTGTNLLAKVTAKK
ncbi:stage II sporulation protein D [Robertmurraya andreesenii]|uniref:Stage II sporulation protein D n=1 Tax=Anoxybacillus andreesenii TaxID=1325932 RepID=A0ABT9V010_9BACL|nr:stage II sporulation protein D [Robertmurraya andreesenii]MDQ0154285.1 stage II sporulation protein D [Robertmurraya andreesenii]